eukprot:3276350-Rhodomonas_salina.1
MRGRKEIEFRDELSEGKTDRARGRRGGMKRAFEIQQTQTETAELQLTLASASPHPWRPSFSLHPR